MPRPATYVSLGIMLALIALIYLAIGASFSTIRSRPGGEALQEILQFPAAYTGLLSFILSLGGFLAVIFGAAVAGSEWTWGTLKNAVARGEGRVRYTTALFVAAVVLIAIGLLISFAVGVLMAAVGSSIAGLGTAGMDDATAIGQLPERLVRSWLAVSEEAALGFAIATIARSQLAGIGAGIAFYFAEAFASLFLPDIVKYMPFTAANAVVRLSSSTGGGFGGGATVRLEPDVAIVVVLIWLVGALVISGLATERADITG